MKDFSINNEQELYVFAHGRGKRQSFTCMGFDVCEKRKVALAKELAVELKGYAKGTEESYKEYSDIIDIAFRKHVETGWRSKSELTPEFIGHEGKRVEVIDAYGEKRRFYIGKSTGFIPCHLEIANSRSHGGGAVTGHPFKSIRFINQ